MAMFVEHPDKQGRTPLGSTSTSESARLPAGPRVHWRMTAKKVAQRVANVSRALNLDHASAKFNVYAELAKHDELPLGLEVPPQPLHQGPRETVKTGVDNLITPADNYCYLAFGIGKRPRHDNDSDEE